MLVRSVRCGWATISWPGLTTATCLHDRRTVPYPSRYRSVSQVPSRNHVTVEHSTSPNLSNVCTDHTRTLVLLRKTIDFLPRASQIIAGQGQLNSLDFWRELLESTKAELSSGPTAASPKARISVCGIGESSGAKELVTALLDDPFSDPAYSDILRNRWKDRPNVIMVEHGPSTTLENHSKVAKLNSPSTWLLQYPYDIQLLEFPTFDSMSEGDIRTTKLLWNSDILILVCDPLLVPIVSLSSVPSEYRRSQVSKELSDLGCEPGRILFLNPVQALRATAGLQTNSDFSLAVERYQNASLNSHISSLGVAVGELLGGRESTDVSSSTLRTRTALIQIQSALDDGGECVACTAERVSQVFAGLAKLRSQVAGARERAEKEVLGGSNDVELVLAQGANRMKAMLGSLSFWNMVWMVDEIEAVVSATVRLEWCKELEDELILQTGRLSCAQDQLWRSTSDFLSTLEAQSAVVGAFVGILGGAGVSWWLAIGSNVLSFGPGAEIASAVGVGAIVAISSIRWAVGKWERAKRKWMQDLERVSDGTKRDLKTSLRRTIDQNVVIIAETACGRLEELAAKRQEEVGAVDADLQALRIESSNCTISSSQKLLR
ncbi:hypothetical protein BKA83DRAFT_4281960 [Pisolithus microcarpus]|nr:hypothetical protein BKA83DRAFT_4281960 [Pisolithus microcarpus]